ncbi:Aquaporin, partial [Phytophthora palmivora]
MTDSNKAENGYIGLQEPEGEMPPDPVKPYQVKSPLLRECMAEFLGTMVLVMFGDGVVAQVVLSEDTRGDFTSISLCWGLGILFGIHVSGGVSGGHINPAVTTTLALYGRFEWRKVIPYIIAQIFGAFVAAFLVWAVYCPMFNTIDP